MDFITYFVIKRYRLAYIKKKFFSQSKVKVFKFLIDNFDISLGEAQRWMDKGRVLLKGKPVVKKAYSFKGEIEVILFIPSSQNLKPIFQTDDFVIFDKPSGVLVHPAGRITSYSITHEVKYLFGKNANITHRLDKETSGLIVCSKNKKVEKDIKMLFENREVTKTYLALVEGEIKEPILIDAPIVKNNNFDDIKLMVYIGEEGKPSSTQINPINYNKEKNQTLVEALPKTGRQHQIRVHLHHIGHRIVGDPLYGLSFEQAESYLENRQSDEERLSVTGASRLMLHAYSLEFSYKNRFKILSQTQFP